MGITIRLYTGTGERGPRVGLALRKSDVGARLLRVLQDADEMKKGGFSIGDLTRLDSGELPLSKIAALYDGNEIETAIQHRLEEITQEGAELDALRELLHSGAWSGANGGPGSHRSREATMRTDWKTLDGAKKSRSSEGGLLMKSSRVGSAADVAVACGWEERDVRKGHGARAFVHGEQTGVTLEIGPESAWTMKQGAKVLAQAEGTTPTQRACGLLAHLAKLHGH